MITIIDFGMGNLFSIRKRIQSLGYDVQVSNDPSDIAASSKLILPGVGHFARAVEQIRNLGLTEALNREVVERRKPILGICLGMQLMAKLSQEGNAAGLGWFDAEVRRFQISDTVANKVPHTGWNQVFPSKASQLLNGISEGSAFYFVHSYYVKLNRPEDQLAYTPFEDPFTSAIEKDNIFGVQFHPEKSHEVGFQMIKNFAEL
ncbi:MAG: imidazole glycerol phosphate synthase subunit HisH [Pyrinomonadaceae bacterium]